MSKKRVNRLLPKQKRTRVCLLEENMHDRELMANKHQAETEELLGFVFILCTAFSVGFLISWSIYG